MLRLQNITKTFSDITAVSELSLEIPQESIFGLLGPNGAGKTTTIRMIMDIIKPDQGQITYQQEPLTKKTYRKIGYLPEERGLYQKRPLAATIEYFAKLKGLDSETAEEQTNHYLDRFDLLAYAKKNIEELSKGNQQKVQFIISIIHEPEILILDEPFSGLDPVNQLLIKDIISEIHENGATIIFSTHQMEQVEKICDTICLINNGKKVLFGKLKEIKRNYGAKIINLEFDGKGEQLQYIENLKDIKISDSRFRAELVDQNKLNSVLREIMSRVDVNHFEVLEPSLEQIFIDNVNQDQPGGLNG